jgi:integrase
MEKAPGLKWIKRRAGVEPYWVAPAEAVKAGFTPRTVPLRGTPEHALFAVCARLTAEAAAYMSGAMTRERPYDGTLGHLIDLYLDHPQSGYQKVKPATQELYRLYALRIAGPLGARKISGISGLDVLRWHKAWTSEGKHLAAGAMTLAVLKAVAKFAVLHRIPGAVDFRESVAAATVPKPQPRTTVITADQVIALRRAAHAAGAPSLALLYAVQFETGLRLWDCLALQWGQVRGNILTVTPSKTAGTTGRTAQFDLDCCPMVIEELAHYRRDRIGPIVAREATGLPWEAGAVRRAWNRIRKAAGLPAGYWGRDIRASASTEARQGGASTDDAAKVAAHSKEVQRRVYDRDVLEAHRRVQQARIKRRNGE